MSEDKSFAPTAKRLEDARRKGEVAVAGEMRHALMLLGLYGAALFAAPLLLTQLAGLARWWWEHAGEARIEVDGAHSLATLLLRQLAGLLLPVFGLMLLAAIAIGFVQGRPTLSWSRVKPQWSKLNPAAGLKRQFGPRGLVEFGKTLLKCIGILAVCAIVLRPHLPAIDSSVGMDPLAVLQTAGGLVLVMVKAVLLLVGALALADFVYQHRSFLKRMRMSLQELRDEHKESDGDPAVKARQRQVGAERARQRMMAAVPGASVVITNPTHYAVALRYDHGAMRAPVVVAKGTDLVALRIREIAGEHQVPIVESPPLARALYASAEVERPIPIEHYAAVAEIISYILGLARARRGG